MVAYLSIFTLGLLHGANDIQLLEKKLSLNTKSIYKVLGGYVTFVLLIGLLFYVIPSFTLVFFILISGFHFGEEHWEDKLTIGRRRKFLFYTSYGLLILFMIFYFNIEETSEIIYALTGRELSETLCIYGIITMIVILLVTSWRSGFNLSGTTTVIEEIIYLLVLGAVFKLSNLLFSFAIYFVVWHAIPSLHSQIKYLYGVANRHTVLQYIKSSFLYWFVSIIGISVFYYFLGDRPYLFNAIFFAFLAAITFPHVWVIYSLRKD